MTARCRTSLAPFIASMRDPDPDGARKFAAKVYRDSGVIVVDPAWITGWGDRELFRKIGERALRVAGRK